MEESAASRGSDKSSEKLPGSSRMPLEDRRIPRLVKFTLYGRYLGKAGGSSWVQPETAFSRSLVAQSCDTFATSTGVS